MNETDFAALLEAARRGRLTPGEEAQAEAWLALHPERRAEWEAEAQLNHALDRLGDVPVPSNFTALVLQAARREAAAAARARTAPSWWRRLGDWLRPRPAYALAAAVALLAAAGLTWRQSRVQQARVQNARDLAVLSCAAALPEPQLLVADFDAVRRLPGADDDELLSVLHEAVSTP